MRWTKSILKRPRIPRALKGPNLTEARFKFAVLKGLAEFEPCKFAVTLNKRRKYTPDFLYIYSSPEGRREVYVEVKGAYRLPSEARARIAWELAAEQNPDKVWVWAKDTGFSHKWRVEVWTDGGRRKACNNIVCHREFIELLVKLLG